MKPKKTFKSLPRKKRTTYHVTGTTGKRYKKPFDQNFLALDFDDARYIAHTKYGVNRNSIKVEEVIKVRQDTREAEEQLDTDVQAEDKLEPAFKFDHRKENPSLHLLYIKRAVKHLCILHEMVRTLYGESNNNLLDVIAAMEEETKKLCQENAAYHDAQEILDEIHKLADEKANR